jgi:site-specific DNA-methyltransferase (adenine-specific)
VREWELHLGDALKVLSGVPDGSVDAVVTDPPYNLAQIGRSLQLSQSGPGQDYDRTAQRNGRERGFMGCSWDDTVAFRPDVWAECLRVAKAGAYLLAFGGTRTHHRMMCAVEDAGWELTDTLCWLHGQGFPKGKGCLKPAWEPIALARKPAPRVLPLNIDEVRIPIVGPVDPHRGGYNVPGNGEAGYMGFAGCPGREAEVPHPDSPRHDARGRWPANVILSHHESCVCRGTKRVRSAGWRDEDGQRGRRNGTAYKCSRDGSLRESASAHHAGPDGAEEVEDWACHPECPVFLLDSQAGHLHARGNRGPSKAGGGLYGLPACTNDFGPGDAGNASRFFYVSKAARRERWFYCADCGDAFEPGERDRHGHGHVGGDGKPDWRHLGAHPTQKPLALMRWLVKLVCPARGLCLDPFSGSGTTGVACIKTGRRFVGIEKDAHYHAIALKRLAAVDGPLFARPAGEALP